MEFEREKDDHVRVKGLWMIQSERSRVVPLIVCRSVFDTNRHSHTQSIEL
jgi:hypothetical protein